MIFRDLTLKPKHQFSHCTTLKRTKLNMGLLTEASAFRKEKPIFAFPLSKKLSMLHTQKSKKPVALTAIFNFL